MPPVVEVQLPLVVEGQLPLVVEVQLPRIVEVQLPPVVDALFVTLVEEVLRLQVVLGKHLQMTHQTQREHAVSEMNEREVVALEKSS